MSENASTQLARIVTVVAELSRRDAAGEPALTLAEVAAQHGTMPEQIQRDLRALTQASDEPDAEWLQSLTIWQEGDRLVVASRGPFRRPIRFTPDELLALELGLAAEAAGDETGSGSGGAAEALSRELAAVMSPATSEAQRYDVAPSAGAGEAKVAALARRAMDEQRVLSILYTDEHDRAGTPRSVEPHQVVFAEGRFYVAAWCRQSGGWRNFRADRVIDAALEDGTFEPRRDFEPFADGEAVFRADAAAVDNVTVRFSPGIARWLEERHPDAMLESDGSALVTFKVADPAWLVRHVLQYGPDAEVVAPAEYREAVCRAVGKVTAA